MRKSTHNNNFPFIITIDDGHVKYEYKMNFPKDVATYDLIKTLANKFEVDTPTGTFIKD